MVNEHAKDALEMVAARDQQPVQTLRPNSPNEPLRDRVGVSRQMHR
jgi:hypothetical protein